MASWTLTPLLWSLAQALYLFAPLLIAATLAGVVQRFDWLALLRKPVDGGASLGGRRIFGSSKTWRGFVLAAAGCMIGTALQKFGLAPYVGRLAVIDYSAVDAFGFGAAMGLGAMLGELPNSFVKRRLGIPPGKTAHGAQSLLFYVWDQVDLLLGAWPCIGHWVHPSAPLVIASFVVTLVLHPTISVIGFALGARRSGR